MDNFCATVEATYQIVEDTDRKAQLEEILAALGCHIPDEDQQQLRSGGAGTQDPDQD